MGGSTTKEEETNRMAEEGRRKARKMVWSQRK